MIGSGQWSKGDDSDESTRLGDPRLVIIYEKTVLLVPEEQNPRRTMCSKIADTSSSIVL